MIGHICLTVAHPTCCPRLSNAPPPARLRISFHVSQSLRHFQLSCSTSRFNFAEFDSLFHSHSCFLPFGMSFYARTYCSRFHDDSIDRAGAPFWHLLFTCMALPCCRCLRHTNSHPNSHSLLLATLVQLPCLTFLGAYLHLPRASYLAACVCSIPNFGLKCLTFNCSFFSLVCFVALRLRQPTYTRIWPLPL